MTTLEEQDNLARYVLNIILVTIIILGIISCLYCCIISCEYCEKNSREKQHNAEIDKNLLKRENDWWVESGGPPVNNGGQIMILELLNN